ncbi:MAG: hypothetical protein EB060_03680 [Proteobacteria bacterium]|nr:hypothetical protein [Pseudomonadota bacterium]
MKQFAIAQKKYNLERLTCTNEAGESYYVYLLVNEAHFEKAKQKGLTNFAPKELGVVVTSGWGIPNAVTDESAENVVATMVAA